MLKCYCGLSLAAVCVVVLTGCAGFSRDAGFTPVAQETQHRLGAEAVWPRDADAQRALDARRVALQAAPLNLEGAVQLALLDNPGLQADFQTLQVSEAALVQAGRLPNPRIDLLRAARDGQYDVEETVSFNVLALLTQPYVHGLAAQHFAAAQDAAIEAVQRLVLETRAAWVDAVAADESLAHARALHEAAALAATLAARMQQAGNWTLIDQAQEQQLLLTATRTLREAEATQEANRQRLLALLGVGAAQAGALKLDALPVLPSDLEPLPDVERTLLEKRIDLRQARASLEAYARQLKLTRATRFVNVLEVGATRIKQGADDAPYEPGVRISLEIPLFDSGEPRLRRAEALYAQASERYAQQALDARAQIGRAYATYRSSYEVARQERDQALPLRQALVAENLKRYNAAQLSVFELLSDARESSLAVLSCIEAQRRFWRARSALDAALLGSDREERAP